MKKITVIFVTLIFSFLSCKTEETISAEKNLNQIVVSSMPNKLVFNVGDKFTADGLELSAYYSDGTVSIIKREEFQITPSYGFVLNEESENKTVKIVCWEQEISYSIIVRKSASQSETGGSDNSETDNSSYSVLYDFDDVNKTATIKGIDGTASVIEIPESINGIYTVEKISSFAFMNCTFIKEIKFPKTLKEIGTQAFVNCTSLEKVILPENLKRIGYNAFGGCENIKYFEVNCSDIEYIPPECLFDRLGENNYPFVTVENIVFTDKVKKVRSNLWSGSFDQMHVESTETVLEPQAFYNCDSCEFYCNTDVPEELFSSFWGKLYLTENVKKIGRLAFSTSGYGVTVGDGTYAAQLPDSIEVIEYGAFSSYPVKNLPKNLKYLGDHAFTGDENGDKYIGFVSKEVIFPENIEYIGEAFYRCSEIERVVIPEYFKDIEIKDTIFDYCNNIKTVCYEGNIYNSNIVYPGPSNVEVKEGVTVFNGPKYNSGITEFIIPEGIVEITNGSFDQCENLKTIKFPSTLKKIGYGVLGSCPALEKIEFDEKSTGIEIGEGFIGCGFEDGEKNKIETFHFPAYVTKVGSGFASGRNLKSITSESLPVKSYSVTQDESGKNTYNIIFGNPGITEITETSWFGSFSYFDREGEATINYIIEEGIEVIDGISPFIDYYDEVKNITIKLPSTLKRIERFASRSKFIKEIEIPDSVEYIGDGAFSGLGLSTVKINDTSSLKYIGESAFSSCALTEINFPEGLEYIGNAAFDSCSIKEIYIPETVKYIGRAAFFEKCDITKFISRAKCDFDINSWIYDTDLKLEQNNIRIYGSTEYGLTSLDYYFNQDYGIILYGEEVDLILSTTSKVKFVCVDSDVKKICKMLSTFDSNFNINKLVPFIFKSETPPVFYGTNDDNDLFFGGGTEKIYVPDNSVETYKSIYTWGKNRITKISELPYELEEMLWE